MKLQATAMKMSTSELTWHHLADGCVPGREKQLHTLCYAGFYPGVGYEYMNCVLPGLPLSSN